MSAPTRQCSSGSWRRRGKGSTGDVGHPCAGGPAPGGQAADCAEVRLDEAGGSFPPSGLMTTKSIPSRSRAGPNPDEKDRVVLSGMARPPSNPSARLPPRGL